MAPVITAEILRPIYLVAVKVRELALAEDVPGVLPGVVGAYRPRSWGVCSCARAGTLLPAPPSHGTRVSHSLLAGKCFGPQNFVAVVFSQRLARVSRW